MYRKMTGKTEKWPVITGHRLLFTTLEIYHFLSLLFISLLLTLLAYTRPDKISFSYISGDLVLLLYSVKLLKRLAEHDLPE